MIKRYTYLGLLGILPFLASAQITNNGATIVIEEGATLVVEAGINNISGAITNSGTIRVKGDFINDGTLSSTTVNSDIIFEGTTTQSFDANGASVRKVTIDNVTNNVSLVATGLTITEELAFGAGSANLDIAGQNLTLGAGASVTRTVNDGYIKADGAGKVVKTYGALESFTFPIGDANAYSPLTADVTTGTAGTATLAVSVANSAHPSLPADANNPNRNTTEYITRYWDIDQSGFGGSFSAGVLGTYDDTDDVVQASGENLIKAALWDGTEWTYDETDNTGTDQVGATITGNRELTGSNTFGKSMVQVILGGAYDDATNMMRTDLNGGASGILATEALTSPYGTGESVAASFFGNNLDIVDWVKIELRSAGDNTSVVAERSAFVDKNGNLLDITGSVDNDVLYFKNAPANSFIVIKHRNHLGMMLNSTTTLLTSIADIDFTDLAANTFGTNAQRVFDGSNMMWTGDVSSDGKLDYEGLGLNELSSLQNSILNHPTNVGFGGPRLSRILAPVYSSADIDMNGILDYEGLGSNELSLLQTSILNHLNNVGFGGPRLSRVISQQIPE